ncbi:MAG: DUF3971 domain-containing protein [Pseudomonadota bacterium]
MAMTAAVALGVLLHVMIDDGEVVLPRLTGDLGLLMGDGSAPRISIGGVGFSLDPTAASAGVRFDDVHLSRGGVDVHLPSVVASVDIRDGLDATLRPQDIDIDGGAVRLARDVSGGFSIGAAASGGMTPLFTGGGATGERVDVSALIADIGGWPGAKVFDALETVALSGIDITFADARRDRLWHAPAAAAKVTRRDDSVRARLVASVDGGGETPTQVSAVLDANLARGTTSLRLRFEDARPEDLASQFRALDWLALLQAPVDAHLALAFDRAGEVTAMEGVLELGAGQVIGEAGTPISFSRAKAYFGYDPDDDVLRIDFVDVATEIGAVRASGQVLLNRGADGAVADLVAQMRLYGLTADVSALPRRLAFEGGRATARISVDPLRVEIGEAELVETRGTLKVTGSAWTEDESWRAALDLRAATLPAAAVFDYWPTGTRPGVRRWLERRFRSGELADVGVFLRLGPQPRFGMDFDFSDAGLRYVDSLPEIDGAAGHARLMAGRLDIDLTAGRTLGVIDLAGSRLEIAELGAQPATALIDIAANGEIGHVLDFLDHRPIALSDRVDLPDNIATGHATLTGEVRLPITPDLTVADIDYRFTSELTSVDTMAVVPGRQVTAEALNLEVSPDDLSIAGPIRLDGVPLNMTFGRRLRDNPTGEEMVRGSLALTNETLEGLGIGVPAGLLSGEGHARFRLARAAGVQPAYRIEADLTGAGLRVPPLGWSKPPGRRADVTLEGTLGGHVERLVFQGGGLRADGQLDLGPSGLTAARFSRLAVGDWLDAPVSYQPRSGGPRIDIAGGRVDARRLPGPGGGGRPVEISLAETRVRVTDGIELTGVTGDISAGSGLNGRFRGQINGAAPVTGVLRDGPTVYLEARDGGGALKAAGLHENLRGGTLRVSLKSLGSGVFDGRFSLQNTWLVNAPVLAEIMAAANPISLLERLSGPGIRFEDAQGWFTLAPGEITVARARATGPALGLRLSGAYRPGADALAIDGVVSPFYTLNGLPSRIPLLGQVLGGRPGEGMFGITFRLSGQASAPQIAVNPLSLLTPGAARDIFATRRDGS